MTKKPVLKRWSTALNAAVPDDATVDQLESGIDNAIAGLTNPEPGPTIGEAIANNWAVLRAEALPTVRAVATNLAGR